MTENETTTPYVPEMIPLSQGWRTDWLVSVESEMDPDNYHAGWNTISADAYSGKVEDNGQELSPTEARNMAMAYLQAADHAEHYGHTVMSVLSNEQGWVAADCPDMSNTESRAVHGWINKAHNRAYRNGHAERALKNPSE
jgi:hypothetical protein